MPEDDLIPLGLDAGPAAQPMPDAVDKVLEADATGAGNVEDLVAPPAMVPGGAPASIDEKIVPPEVDAVSGGKPETNAATDAILAKLPPTGDAAKPGVRVTPESVIAKQGELDAQKAQDATRAAEEAHLAAIDHQADVQDALDHGNATLAKRRGAYDEALAKYDKMKVHDYWDAPTHSRFAAGVALALGGLGAALSAAGGGSGENRVLAQLNKKIDDDYKMQMGQIEKARDSVLMAKTGIQDAREAKAALLEDASAKRAATLGALETEARRQLAERGVPAAAIDADNRVLQLQAARVKAQREADEQRRKDALAAAQVKYLEARAGKLGRGSGGGGGGAGKPGAIADFKKAIVEGTDDGKGGTRPLNAEEIQRVADKLGIPAVAKAGRPSVENLTKDVAFVAGLKTKADAAEQKRSDAIDKDLQKELYPTSGKGPGTQLERIQAMRAGLKDAIAGNDPTAATSVLEEAGGMLSGGKSTKNTVHLLEELKSVKDELKSKWGRITGDPGNTKEYTQRLDKLLAGVEREKQFEIDSITKRYEERRAKAGGKPVASETKDEKDAVKAAAKGPSPEDISYLRGVYNDKSTSAADRAKAALALKNFGLNP
jgi:hypothetical protein